MAIPRRVSGAVANEGDSGCGESFATFLNPARLFTLYSFANAEKNDYFMFS